MIFLVLILVILENGRLIVIPYVARRSLEEPWKCELLILLIKSLLDKIPCLRNSRWFQGNDL